MKIAYWLITSLFFLFSCGGGGGGKKDIPIDTSEPDLVVEEINTTVASTTYDSNNFLFTGENPIQIGVAENTIKPQLIAVVRGKVLDRNNNILSGVKVSVIGHSEFGHTTTGNDGVFDLALNGGKTFNLQYEKEGYLSVHRNIDAPWQDFAWLPDIVMNQVDSAVTEINFNDAGMKVARANKVIDDDGERQPTLIIPEQISAQLVMADGSSQSADTLNIRLTEYTVGDNGPESMPAELPPSSGYTYALEFSADEAINSGATEVRFDKPLFHYVEDFIGFPVGSAVPTGYYDRQQGKWIASENGRVIKVLAITAGLAELDTTGDGLVDNGVAMDVTNEERKQLASLYVANQALWRVPIKHFSPWDCNWPYGPPPKAVKPKPAKKKPRKPAKPCKGGGSIIKCQTQTLGEDIPITGTSFNLHYESDRVPGRRDAYIWDIELTGDEAPADAVSVELNIRVAGQRFQKSFPVSANLSYSFEWDGKDAYGRRLQGPQPITVDIGYTYQGRYYPVGYLLDNAFARIQGQSDGSDQVLFSSMRSAQLITIWSRVKDIIGAWNTADQGLGGWSLSVNHIYSPQDYLLLLGDGESCSSLSLSDVISTIAGTGNKGFNGDKDLATETELALPMGVAIGEDGSVYVSDYRNHRIRRIDPSGTIETIAGIATDWSHDGYGGDGGLATEARLSTPRGIEIGTDGSIYFAELNNWRVRKIDANGIITTVAGSGYVEDMEGVDIGDGGLATEAIIAGPSDVVVTADGTLFISDAGNHRIRRVGTDGIISTIAGTGEQGVLGDGGLAIEAKIDWPHGLALGSDGSIYFSDRNNSLVRKVSPDGIMSRVAGTEGQAGFAGDGGLATEALLNMPYNITLSADDVLYIADQANMRIRRVTPDGIITTVAGSDVISSKPLDGHPPTSARLTGARDIAIDPNGYLYIADTYAHRVRKVIPALPAFSDAGYVIASENAEEVYSFDKSGRHLKTINSLTNANIYEFGYDTDGGLVSVTDVDNKVTTIERDSSGNPTGIIAPGGQRTTLTQNSQGYLSNVSNPAGEMIQLSYTDSGLLTSYQDANNNITEISYDARGRLSKEKDASGATLSLTREDDSKGYTVTKTTELGRKTVYRLEYPAGGNEITTKTFPNSGVEKMVFSRNGKNTITYPDGSIVQISHGPDPRFGMQAPLLQSLKIASPKGLTSELINSREVTLQNVADPLSLVSLKDTINVNSREFTIEYNATNKTLTNTSPEGNQITSQLDNAGRLIKAGFDTSMDAVELSYNTLGLLSKLKQGARSWDYSYDTNHRISNRTDAANNVAQYEYDMADRVNRLIYPGDGIVDYSYDNNSNRTQVTMPSGKSHSLAYSSRNLLTNYTPPNNESFDRHYDADKALTKHTLASGKTIENVFDENTGQWLEMNYGTTKISYGYDSCCEQVKNLNRKTADDLLVQGITYEYDGALLEKLSYSGTTNAAFSYEYNNNFFPIKMTVNSGSDAITVNYEYDDDGFQTAIGSFDMVREGPLGATDQIGDGNLILKLSYDKYGDVIGRDYVVNGLSVYKYMLQKNSVGLTTQKSETVSGTSEVFDYTYDADGQLKTVMQGTTTLEDYNYDVNRNRLARNSTYDQQDRITALDGATYQVNVDGFLQKRGNDTFTYSERGELLSIDISGSKIDYEYDGLARRITRTDSNGSYEYFYGNPANPFLVTAVRGPSGVFSLYYYDEQGLLYAMDRAASRYYIAVDQVGSPKVIIDTTGTVTKSFEFDSYGQLLSESNPSFEFPFGFAGGLRDKLTGLVRFGYRDYNPDSGRWTARDPVLYQSGQLNHYVYVGNNPIDFRDPLGLWCVGGSFYRIVGAGAQVCCKNGICSYCGEVGLGIGNSAEFGSGAPSQDQESLSIGASGSCGPAGLGAECAFNFKCGPGCNVSGNIGPTGWNSNGDVSFSPGSVGWKNKCGAQAKLAYKNCIRF